MNKGKLLKNTELLFDFIYNRQLIWYKKEILKENYPWSNDKILN